MEEDRILFWKLTEVEHLRARAFCRKLMGNRDDGDDLYHDTLVIALPRFYHLRDRSAFRPWLYRIAVNTFKNRFRCPWWKRLTPLTPEIEESSGGGNPEAVQAARRRLQWAFRAIMPEERALVILFEMEGWTISELARLFGKNEGTIKVRLSRARRKMREAIVKRFHQSKAEPFVATIESEDGICVAMKPRED
jgi:RNA polymerase sigma-70 factor (ECF subfamily)